MDKDISAARLKVFVEQLIVLSRVIELRDDVEVEGAVEGCVEDARSTET